MCKALMDARRKPMTVKKFRKILAPSFAVEPLKTTARAAPIAIAREKKTRSDAETNGLGAVSHWGMRVL